MAPHASYFVYKSTMRSMLDEEKWYYWKHFGIEDFVVLTTHHNLTWLYNSGANSENNSSSHGLTKTRKQLVKKKKKSVVEINKYIL